tara:strand:- start:5632 stop:8223 length:2592 start_codon:yes stop_codon:yes gene_type:complete
MFRSIGTQWMFDTGIHPGVVTQSARFSDVSNKYLQRTDSTTPTSTQKFTFSCWLKNSTLNSGDTIFGSDKGTAGGPGDAAWIQFTTNRRLNIYNITGASYNLRWTSDAMYRDVADWYHFVIRVDTTQGSADDRVRLYVNGTQQTGSYDVTVGQNNNISFNNAAGKFRIAGLGYADGYEGDFYLADIHHCDGYSYAPTEFGEDKNGVWIPKIASVSYGNTGYRLEFKNSTVGSTSGSASTIGADTSGNGHHFNDYNMGIDDSNIPDCPENNFCTLNPISAGDVSDMTQGALQYADNRNGGTGGAKGTFAVSSGRWYWEVHYDYDPGASNMVGITAVDEITTSHTAQDPITGYGTYFGWDERGLYYFATDGSGSNTSGHTSYVAGDIISFAMDVDAGKLFMRKNNNAWEDSGNPANGTNPSFTFGANKLMTPMVNNYRSSRHIFNFGQNPSFSGDFTGGDVGTEKGGGGTFKYAPPRGFNALCSNALEDGIISPNPSASSAPTDYFNTVLYTGLNNTAQSITDVGFQADLLWAKSRSNTSDHYWYDSLRGANKAIMSNKVNQEDTASGQFTQFTTTGFDLPADTAGYINYNARTYAGWCWKAGGAPTASNTAGVGEVPTAGSVLIDGKQATAPLAGSIKIDKLSANTISGFSIVTYTANSNTQCTLPHGLNSAPNMVIIKNRDASPNGQWVVGQDAYTGFTGQMYFNDTGAFSSNSGSFANTAPTSSVVTINTDNTVNEGTDEFVMYCFHSVEGYSKIGSYRGNSSTDGTFVYTGFRPAWLMIRNASNGGAWCVFDNKQNPDNAVNLMLLADQQVDTSGGGTGDNLDFLSNGFKLRDNSGGRNTSSQTYIYMAIAEADFKTSNAR